MKVALVLPPCNYKEIFGKLTGSNPILVPLDISYIAAYLESKGHHVTSYDCPAADISMQQLKVLLESLKPQLVAVTVDLPTLSSTLVSRAYGVARISKQIDPDIKTALCGFYPSRFPGRVMKKEEVDFAVIGEGELTVAELCHELENGRGPENVDGLAFKKGGQIIINKQRQLIADLDILPFPAYHLLPVERYRSCPTSRKRFRQMTLLSSRGCPFCCSLCTSPQFWRRKWRAHSPEYVVANMDYIYERYGIGDFQFRDDAFTVDRERVIRLCALLAKRKKRYCWSCYTTFNLIDDELIRLMKEAGCYQLDLGVEAGSDQVLKEYKGFDKSLARRLMRRIKQVGIGTRLFFIIGHPSKTESDVAMTIDFAIELDPDYAIFTPSVPYPGTEFYDRLIEEGYELSDFEDRLFVENKACCDLPGFSQEYINKMLGVAFRRFYFRPGYILRRSMSIRSIYDLRNQIQGALPLLSYVRG